MNAEKQKLRDNEGHVLSAPPWLEELKQSIANTTKPLSTSILNKVRPERSLSYRLHTRIEMEFPQYSAQWKLEDWDGIRAGNEIVRNVSREKLRQNQSR